MKLQQIAFLEVRKLSWNTGRGTSQKWLLPDAPTEIFDVSSN